MRQCETISKLFSLIERNNCEASLQEAGSTTKVLPETFRADPWCHAPIAPSESECKRYPHPLDSRTGTLQNAAADPLIYPNPSNQVITTGLLDL